MNKKFFIWIMTVVGLIPVIGHAVVFYSTGDPSYNATAPVGNLSGSGWELQGEFGSYLGTPVGPHHFITAQHISGSGVADGTLFSFNGINYTTKSRIHDPDSDLTLWEIEETFPVYAPLYSGGDEVGKTLVVFGRGWERSDAVDVSGRSKGWKLSGDTKIMRWGTNMVDSISTATGFETLMADFDSDSGYECALGPGDSGGGLFIEEDGIWKLAAINYSIFPAIFNYTADVAGEFYGAMFDYRELYYKSGSTWYYGGRRNNPLVSSSFYSTRISSRYTWITNNVTDFDVDVDGLPDWWETTYCGDAVSMQRDGHLDDDGFSNYEEWMSDTDPCDSESCFQLLEWSVPTNVVFTSSTNRWFLIESCDDITDSNKEWQIEHNWFVGSVTQSMKTLSIGTGNGFFRIKAKIR